MEFAIKRLLSCLNIRPNETGKVLLATGVFFSIAFYCTAIESISQAVFNVRVGVEYLPYMYMILAFSVVGMVGLLSGLFLRHDKRIVFRGVVLFVLIKQGAGIFILQSSFHPVCYAVFFLVSQLFLGLLGYTTWVLLQEVSDLDFSKRLFSVVSAAGIVGAIAGSAFVGLASVKIGVTGVYAISSVFPLWSMACADSLLKKYRLVKLEASDKDEQMSLGRGLSYLKSNPFYLNLLFCGIVLFLCGYIVDYQFNYVAMRAIEDEAKLSAFMGNYQQVKNGLSFAISVFVFSRIVVGFGIMATSFVLPASALIAGCIAFSSQELYATTAAKTIVMVFIFSQSDAIFQIFYQPIEKRYKDAVIGLLGAGMEVGAMVCGGLVTLLHSEGLVGYSALSVLTVLLACATFLGWNANRKRFKEFIAKSLKFSTDADLKSILGKRPSPEFLEFLRNEIESGEASARFLALEVMERLEFPEKGDLMVEAYRTGSIEVRFHVIEWVFRHVSAPDFHGMCKSLFPLLQRPEEQFRAMEFMLPHIETIPEELIREFVYAVDISVFEEAVCETRESYRHIHRYLVCRTRSLPDSENDSRVSSEPGADCESEIGECLEMLEQTDVFRDLIRSLLNTKRSEDIFHALKILGAFSKRHPEVVREFLSELKALYLDTKDRILLVELIDVFSSTDEDLEFFTTCVSPLHDIEALTAAVSRYPAERLLDALADAKAGCEIQRGLYLLAVTGLRGTRGTLRALMALNDDLLAHLVRLKRNMRAVEEQHSERNGARSAAVKLLRVEIDSFSCCALAVSAIFALKSHGIQEVEFVADAVRSRHKREMLIEILQDALPRNLSKIYLELLKEERLARAVHVDQSVFAAWPGAWIEHLARYIGELPMSENMTEMLERMVALKCVPLFSELNAEELYRISLTTRYERVSKGEVVIREGESGMDLYIVVEGCVGIYARYGTDTQREINRMGEGAVLGELAVVSRQKRSATVATLEKTLFLVMDGERFLSLLPVNSTISMKLIQALAQRLMDVTTGTSSKEKGE